MLPLSAHFLEKGGYITLDFLPDEALVITVRLLAAVILCGFIGLEREIQGHQAGFRTHLLVGLGACLMIILSNYGFEEFLANHPAGNVRMDPSRLPAYVVSGIGFLGAGTIIVHGSTIRGLTTAASIWVAAGIGLVVGSGMYYTALLATTITILSLLFLNRIESTFIRKPKTKQLHVIVNNKMLSLSEVVKILEAENMKVRDTLILDYPNINGEALINFSLLVKYPDRGGMTANIYDKLNEMEHVYKVYTKER